MPEIDKPTRQDHWTEFNLERVAAVIDSTTEESSIHR